MAVTSFETFLVKKEKNSSDAWDFYFRKPKSFQFEAGQYIKMWMEIKHPDDRGVTRYFTLSASPTEEHLRITTRILKSTFKLALADVKIGDKVKMRGPWGDFILPQENKNSSLVFIAGGIGMTPYRSILKYVFDSGIKRNITLFVSYKTEDQILFREELEKISSENPHIKIITTITDENEKNWEGERGRITPDVLKRHLDSLKDNLYYIAGPDPLVEGVKKLLLSAGVVQDMILEDGFPGY